MKLWWTLPVSAYQRVAVMVTVSAKGAYGGSKRKQIKLLRVFGRESKRKRDVQFLSVLEPTFCLLRLHFGKQSQQVSIRSSPRRFLTSSGNSVFKIYLASPTA